MAGRSAIPLDDEPVDIDLGDLPTDEELEAAAAAGADDGSDDQPEPSGGGGGGGGGYVERDTSPLALFQMWVVLVVGMYALTGLAVSLVMAFRGASQAGLSALGHPGFYLVVFFWPIAIWQLFWNQF